MSLLPERASYFEEVQACFLAFRGDGLALSARDVGLVFEWHARQIPSEVICRGIRIAAERAIQDARVTSRPRSLRACRREIEREIARYLTLSAGKPPLASAGHDLGTLALPVSTPNAPSAHWRSDIEKPASALDESEAAYARERLRQARRTLDDLGHARCLPAPRLGFLAALLDAPTGTDEEVDEGTIPLGARLTRFEEALAIFSLRAQPFAVRRAAIERARLRAGSRPRLASPEARRQSLRHHLIAEIRALDLFPGSMGVPP